MRKLYREDGREVGVSTNDADPKANKKARSRFTDVITTGMLGPDRKLRRKPDEPGK